MKEGTCRDHFNAEETILLEMTLEGIPEQPVGLDVIQHSGFQSEDFINFPRTTKPSLKKEVGDESG